MRLAPVVLATLCVSVLFLGLDRVGFLDWREARDAQVAREMLVHREVLTPIYGRAALFEKPVLAYAPELLARRLSPGSPLRSRQVRAVFALFLLVGTASLGARLLSSPSVIDQLDEGKTTLSIRICDHHLPPGDYSLSLGIARGTEHIYYAANLFPFTLSDLGVNDPLIQPYLVRQRDQMGAFIPGRWAKV